MIPLHIEAPPPRHTEPIRGLLLVFLRALSLTGLCPASASKRLGGLRSA